MLATACRCREAGQTWSFRGSKSRNKVSVGEPAEGSLLNGLSYDLQPFNLWKQNVLWRSGATLMQNSFVSESHTNIKTFNKGSLGSRNDEERSEARNVV